MTGSWWTAAVDGDTAPLTIETLTAAIEESRRRAEAFAAKPYYIVSPREYARMKAKHEARK